MDIRQAHASWMRCIATLALLFSMLPGHAEIPRTIAYQGVVTDATTGNPVNGAVSMTFRLFTEVTSGTPVWEETHDAGAAVVVNSGLFSVQLGSIVPFELNFDQPYFLETQVNTDPPMTPRQPLNSVAYSMRAGGGPVETTVDCSQGSVGDAIRNAPIGGPLVINVQGTCNENLVITRDNLTLRGDGNDKIVGVLPNEDVGNAVIRGAGVRNLSFDNITIEGPPGDTTGVTGLTLHDAAGAYMQNGTVFQNLNGTCVFAQEASSLDVRDSTIQDCAGWGLSMARGSHLDALRATVRRIGRNAIDIHLGSSSDITDTTVTDAGQRPDVWGSALSVNEGSSVRLNAGNTFRSSSDNPGDGVTVFVYRQSSLRIRGGGNLIHNTEGVIRGTSYSGIGAYAIEAGMGSVVRVDGGRTTIRGNVHSFNLTTVDIRNAEIFGNVFADGLNANVRLRPIGSDTVDVRLGNVKTTGDGHVNGRSNARIHDGDLLCNFGNASSSIQVLKGTRVNCPSQQNDIDVVVDGPDDVTAGGEVNFTVTISNEGTNTRTNLDFSGNLNDHAGNALGPISDVVVISGSPSCQFGDDHFNCYLDQSELAPGASVAVRVVAHANNVDTPSTVDVGVNLNVHAGSNVGEGFSSHVVQIVPAP